MDASLLSAALRIFVGAVFALQRRRARQLGIEEPAALLANPLQPKECPDMVLCDVGYSPDAAMRQVLSESRYRQGGVGGQPNHVLGSSTHPGIHQYAVQTSWRDAGSGQHGVKQRR